MGDREKNIEEYRQEVHALWRNALKLHGCSGCAVRDIEARVLITAECIGGSKLPRSCQGFCGGVLLGTALIRHGKLVDRGVGIGLQPGAGKFSLSRLVSLSVNCAWLAGSRVSDCDDCVKAALLCDIRQMEAATDESDGEDGFVSSCRRCRAPQYGLV